MTEGDTAIDINSAGQCAEALAALGYYPRDSLARSLIAEAIIEICRTTTDATWLVRRALQLHESWSTCGVKGLWQIWFSKHTPRNEREAAIELTVGSSSAYPEDVPPETTKNHPLLAKATLLALPPGHVSADPELNTLVHGLAAGRQLGASKQSLYQFELNLHYTTLKSLGATDLIQAVLRNSISADRSGMVEYAKRFWHGIFQDFQELRNLFPDHAARFGPYMEPEK